MTPLDVVAHVEARLPGFQVRQEPVPLSGGLMNFLWRIHGHQEAVIVKYAPPYIAALPDVTLDQARIGFEAKCLQAFARDGSLKELAGQQIRPPKIIDFDQRKSILIQEDVGNVPDLGVWLRQETHQLAEGASIGQKVGQFIGKLHRTTFRDQTFRKTLNNITIQQERFQGQYMAIAAYLKRGAVTEAESLGQFAIDLGQRLMQPGICLIMGDLWPPSVLVTSQGLRIIDWEFAHFGQPAQDVAHLAAHLWMHFHRASTEHQAKLASALLTNFLEAYWGNIGPALTKLYAGGGLRDCEIHFGAELLARTIGVYQPGYLYDGLSPSAPAVKEAVQAAVAHIDPTEVVNTFSFPGDE